MNAFEGALRGASPALIVVIDRELTDAELEENLGYADVAEYRADYFGDKNVAYHVDQVQRLAIVPTIVTVRSGAEGGHYEGPPGEWHQLYSQLIGHAPAVDIETNAPIATRVVADARALKQDDSPGPSVILSHHDFFGVNLASLNQHHQRAKLLKPDLYKYACRLETPTDFLIFSQFLQSLSEDRIIASAMSKMGLKPEAVPLIRALMPWFGSQAIYASAIGSQPLVDGMPNVIEMRKLIDWLYPVDR